MAAQSAVNVVEQRFVVRLRPNGFQTSSVRCRLPESPKSAAKAQHTQKAWWNQLVALGRSKCLKYVVARREVMRFFLSASLAPIGSYSRAVPGARYRRYLHS